MYTKTADEILDILDDAQRNDRRCGVSEIIQPPGEKRKQQKIQAWDPEEELPTVEELLDTLNECDSHRFVLWQMREDKSGTESLGQFRRVGKGQPEQDQAKGDQAQSAAIGAAGVSGLATGLAKSLKTTTDAYLDREGKQNERIDSLLEKNAQLLEINAAHRVEELSEKLEAAEDFGEAFKQAVLFPLGIELVKRVPRILDGIEKVFFDDDDGDQAQQLPDAD